MYKPSLNASRQNSMITCFGSREKRYAKQPYSEGDASRKQDRSSTPQRLIAVVVEAADDSLPERRIALLTSVQLLGKTWASRGKSVRHTCTSTPRAAHAAAPPLNCRSTAWYMVKSRPV
mmetsp:Transcript_59195/g.142818  ORF Transcript_59195/g.142818 Transcript_59195/m.142818 type:complete len:119 (-) Transcript_59195:872-1228(-)